MAARPKKKPAPAAQPAPAEPGERLLPPTRGAVVRMYRIGHGDCFLLAFSPGKAMKPVYVLIDCGYKPGSEKMLQSPTSAAEIAQNIIDATGGHVHVAVITHEHQDHCNGISDENFAGLTIGQVWLAWTEDPNDDLANRLRAKFKDQLLGLAGAHQRLAAGSDLRGMVEEMLELELGDAGPGLQVAAAFGADGAGKDPKRSPNKRSMAVFKRLAGNNVDFHVPHDRIRTIEGAPDLRVFSLGPPRDEKKLKNLDPVGREEFHIASGFASAGAYFGAAAGSGATGEGSPFPRRFAIPRARLLSAEPDDVNALFFRSHYGLARPADAAGQPAAVAGDPSAAPAADPPPEEVGDNEDWRRIETEWLNSAGALALAMNSQTNNASLVLAFELSKGGKVLLFAADAQAGNWKSWADKDWTDGDEVVTTRDLLGRTVLYKVGHHGSHNATLDGQADDAWPNVGWMARGARNAGEFVSMITAVEAWAHQKPKPDWNHPLPSIKKTLLAKAGGRVLQTDTDLADMKPGGDAAEWDDFQQRVEPNRLYFDLTIKP